MWKTRGGARIRPGTGNQKNEPRKPKVRQTKRKKKKKKKESLAHIRKISVNYFARKSLRSFLPFFSSRSLERRGEYLGYLGRWNRIDSKLENLASLETAKMLLSLVSRWIRVAPGGRVHTHTHTCTHIYKIRSKGRGRSSRVEIRGGSWRTAVVRGYLI